MEEKSDPRTIQRDRFEVKSKRLHSNFNRRYFFSFSYFNLFKIKEIGSLTCLKWDASRRVASAASTHRVGLAFWSYFQNPCIQRLLIMRFSSLDDTFHGYFSRRLHWSNLSYTIARTPQQCYSLASFDDRPMYQVYPSLSRTRSRTNRFTHYTFEQANWIKSW